MEIVELKPGNWSLVFELFERFGRRVFVSICRILKTTFMFHYAIMRLRTQ